MCILGLHCIHFESETLGLGCSVYSSEPPRQLWCVLTTETLWSGVTDVSEPRPDRRYPGFCLTALYSVFSFFFLSSKYVLSCYYYCGSGIQVQLRWVPLAQAFSWDSSQTVSQDSRVSSEGSTSTRSSPRSLVRLFSGLMGPLHRVTSTPAAGLPQGQQPERGREQGSAQDESHGLLILKAVFSVSEVGIVDHLK